MTLKYVFALTAAALALTVNSAHASEDDEEHVFEGYGLEVLHPWTRATTGSEALFFMEIHNEGDAEIEIIGVSTEDGAEGGLVGFRLVSGRETYEDLPRVPVGPGQELELGPLGLAVRVTGLEEPLAEGEDLDAMLVTSAGAIEVEFAVEAEDAQQHSHAGHSH